MGHLLRKLDEFEIPTEYYPCLRAQLKGNEPFQKELLSTLEPGHVTEKKYVKFFKTLLWLEEVAGEMELEKFVLEEVLFEKLVSSSTFRVSLHGFVGHGPRICEGSRVLVDIPGTHLPQFTGIVVLVEEDHIVIKISSRLNKEFNTFWTQDRRFNVKFMFNRLRFEKIHKALHGLRFDIGIFFPELKVMLDKKDPFHLLKKFFNDKVGENLEQKQAVENVLNCSSGRYPYIIFGPPGTGKSATLAEIVYQFYMLDKKILVCAPSNAACDLLALKFSDFCDSSKMVRICSKSAKFSEKPGFKRLFMEKGMRLRHQIVVSTLVLCGRFEDYHPDVVIIDEAGQALEPETLIPISLLQRGGSIVLAGDPKQLGPICDSSLAKRYGLGVSLLERLVDLPLYKSSNRKFITMLKTCYRCAPAIIATSNCFFYNKQLKCFPTEDRISTISISQLLLNKVDTKSYSVEFIPVIATEQQDSDSFSFYNSQEITIVCDIVNVLLNNSLNNCCVKQDEIGIVTPYTKQQTGLLKKLKKLGLENVLVGTTEKFQGAEKRIMIISTVRGKESLDEKAESRNSLGFVSCKKRFNVAVTRAKSKLILVGNPLVLKTDVHWGTFIDFCKKLQNDGLSKKKLVENTL